MGAHTGGTRLKMPTLPTVGTTNREGKQTRPRAHLLLNFQFCPSTRLIIIWNTLPILVLCCPCEGRNKVLSIIPPSPKIFRDVSLSLCEDFSHPDFWRVGVFRPSVGFFTVEFPVGFFFSFGEFLWNSSSSSFESFFCILRRWKTPSAARRVNSLKLALFLTLRLPCCNSYPTTIYLQVIGWYPWKKYNFTLK